MLTKLFNSLGPSWAWEDDFFLVKGNSLPVDVIEEEDNFVIKADVPGFKSEDLKLEVKENLLILRGKREKEKKENGKVKIFERFSGEFSRSFTLPHNVDSEDIKAKLEDGVLTVKVPKNIKQKEVKAIKIN
jgi:HSP20 family protein